MPEPALRVVADVACTVCGCVCDDLRLTVAGERIVRAEGACWLAEPWFLAQGARQPPVAEIEGRAVALEEALEQAAAIVRAARSPLIYGLSRSNTDGQRAALALADRIGATIDTTASRGHAPSVLALQEAGESTCTLGEVRNRADLVVFWGSDPLDSHPRHFERYSVDAKGLFVPHGRSDRTVVVVDVRRTASAERADLVVQVEPRSDFEVLWALRGLVRGVTLAEGPLGGVPLAVLRGLAERMKRCKCGIAFFGLGLSRQGHRTVEALLRLVTDLNAHARWYARRMRVSGDVAGADSVLAWQTGYPFAVNLGRGYPRYNVGEFSAQEMLLRGEVDACVLVGSQGVRRFEAGAVAALAALPTVVLDGPDTTAPFVPTVRITTAVPGVHVAGTAYRMDEVPVPLRAVLATRYPSDGEVLERLLKLTPARTAFPPSGPGLAVT
jgi:formylmethanofuran dehydrogenase subunit B